MKVATILLLGLWLSLSLSPSLGEANCERDNWKEQRAVKVAEDLSLSAETWMSDPGMKKIGDSCAGSGSADECAKSSVSVHFFQKKDKVTGAGTGKTYMVISDLTRALKCDSATQKCGCAEKDTQVVEMDGAKLCIKKTPVEKYKECIHHAECGDEKTACIYEAIKETNGDCGEIEDLRRFCSGARRNFPPAPTLPLLLFVGVQIVSKQA